MKDLIGVAAMMLVFYGVFVFELPPGWEEIRAEWRAACPTGLPVVVNGKVMACSDDPPNYTQWTPEGDWRDVKLVPMNWDWDED